MYVSAHDIVVHDATLGHQVGHRRESEHEGEHHLYIYTHVIQRDVHGAALVVGDAARQNQQPTMLLSLIHI